MRARATGKEIPEVDHTQRTGQLGVGISLLHTAGHGIKSAGVHVCVLLTQAHHRVCACVCVCVSSSTCMRSHSRESRNSRIGPQETQVLTEQLSRKLQPAGLRSSVSLDLALFLNRQRCRRRHTPWCRWRPPTVGLCREPGRLQATAEASYSGR